MSMYFYQFRVRVRVVLCARILYNKFSRDFWGVSENGSSKDISLQRCGCNDKLRKYGYIPVILSTATSFHLCENSVLKQPPERDFNMAKIKEIYSNDDYYPFLAFCESRGMEEMKDLARCPFHKLRAEAEISALQLSKIKAIFVTYCRTHTSEFLLEKKASPRPAAKVVPDAEIEQELECFFQAHANKLIRITEITKATSKKVKRTDVVKILQKAPWCKEVDDTTYFYSPT